MIGVDNQYVFSFSIGDQIDFILEEDLHIFKLYEEPGNVLPTFILSFDTQDDDVLRSIHEGNDFKVSFGPSIDDLDDVSLIVTSMQPIRSGDSKRTVSVSGLMSKLTYLNSPQVTISDKKSGVEVIKDVVSKYFNTSMWNVSKSVDSMNWVQSSLPDRAFVNDVWMHSDITNSFLATAISSSNEFILKDIKKALKNSFKYRFTSNPQSATDISYDGDFFIDMNSGFINNWVGYPREKLVYNLEQGTETHESETAEPLLALTQDIARRADIETKFATAGVINENVHANFWQCYLRNLANLGVLGSVSLILSFGNRFVPILPLDLVMFKEDSTQNKLESAEFLSGMYITTGITRTLQHRQFATTVRISRESFNQLKGTNLVAPAKAVVPAAPPLTDDQKLLADLKTRFPGRF